MKHTFIWRILSAVLTLFILSGLLLGVSSCGSTPSTDPEDQKRDFNDIRLGMTEDEVKEIFGEFESTDDTKKPSNMSATGEVAHILKVERFGHEDCTFGYFRGEQYHRITNIDRSLTEAIETNQSMDVIDEIYARYNEAILVPYSVTRFTFNKKGELIEAFIAHGCLKTDNYEYGDSEKESVTVEQLDDEELVKGNKIEVCITFDDGSIYVGYTEITKISYNRAVVKHPWGTASIYFESDNAE